MAERPLSGALTELLERVDGTPEDGSLLALYLSGNESAFEAIVRRHGPTVVRVCRQILDAHDADDAFQATFLVLARKAASIGRGELLGNWLYGVAYRVALRARARAARRRERERPLPEDAGPAPSPAIPELWIVLHEEVQRLPGKYRLPVVLCYLEGRSNEEAARQLGWPRGTVSGRLARAREMLNRRLCRRGVALPAAGVALTLWAGSAPAAVPAALVGTTIANASSFVSGAGGISSSVIELTEGVLNAMFVSKIKSAVLVVVAVLAAGGLFAATRQHTTPAPREAPAAVAPRDGDAGPPALAARRDQAPQEQQQPDEEQKAKRAEPRPKKEKDKDAKNDKEEDKKEEKPKKEESDKGPKERTTIKFNSGSLRGMAISPDGGRLAVPAFPGAEVWDVKTEKKVATLAWKMGYQPLAALAFTADGKSVAATHGSGAEVWDLATEKSKSSLTWSRPKVDADTGQVLGPTVTTASLSADTKWAVTLSSDFKLRVYEMATGKLINTIAIEGRRGRSAPALSPDGKSVAAVIDGKPKQWNVQSGKEVALESKESIDTYVTSLHYSTDGKTLVAVTHSGVKLWALGEKGKERYYQKRSLVGGTAAALSPDGKLLALAPVNEKLTVIDVATKKVIATYHWVSDPGIVTFTADGKTLVSVRGDRIRFWDVPAATKEK